MTADTNTPDYSNFYTEHDGSTLTDKRVSPISVASYPKTFDGRITSNLGGFKVKLSTSYPLGDNITLTQIQQAIAQIQE